MNNLTPEQQYIKNELETAQRAVAAAHSELLLAASTLERLSENAPEDSPILIMEYLDNAMQMVDSVLVEGNCNLLMKNLRN